MHSLCAALTTFALVILSAIAKPLTPPTTGWLYTNVFGSFIFPFTATQCDPSDIFYNTTANQHFYFYDFTHSHILFTISNPDGIGYLEWICNVPAGLGFRLNGQNFTVQPGSSSACLGNITTTYSYLSYYTTNFASYTQNPSLPATPPANDFYTTTSFPIGAYSTMTLNPNLAVMPTTSPPSSSSPVTSFASLPSPSPSPTPSYKSRNAAVSGGVVGAVAFVLLIVALLLWRRRRSSLQASATSSIKPQPAAISGLITSELGPTDLSSPQRSDAERLGRTHTPDGDAVVAPVINNPAAIAIPIGEGSEAPPYTPPLVSQRPSQGTITPFVAEPAFPSQQPRKLRDEGRQASEPSPLLDLPSRTPPTAEQQSSYAQSSKTLADAASETSQTDAVPLFQESSTSETQEGPLGLAAVLGVISRAQLSTTDRLTAVHNLLGSDPSGQPDLARQSAVSSPPPYDE